MSAKEKHISGIKLYTKENLTSTIFKRLNFLRQTVYKAIKHYFK